MKRKLEEFKLIEEFVMIDTNEIKSASSEATFGNFNPVENLLIYKCLSIKTLKKILNCSKNTIKHYIYSSKFIVDAVPLLHGSGKVKINVYQLGENTNLAYYIRTKKSLKKKRNDVLGEITSST